MKRTYKVISTCLDAVVGLWGWSPLLLLHLMFIVLDDISGMMTAGVEGKLSSRR